MLGPDGVVEAEVRSNSLIVTDTITALNRIDAMIPSLDELTSQVLIETKSLRHR